MWTKKCRDEICNHFQNICRWIENVTVQPSRYAKMYPQLYSFTVTFIVVVAQLKNCSFALSSFRRHLKILRLEVLRKTSGKLLLTNSSLFRIKSAEDVEC